MENGKAVRGQADQEKATRLNPALRGIVTVYEVGPARPTVAAFLKAGGSEILAGSSQREATPVGEPDGYGEQPKRWLPANGCVFHVKVTNHRFVEA